MKYIAKIVVLSFLVLVFNSYTVLAEDTKIDLDSGEMIFTANCAACHAGGNNNIMPEKTLKIDVLKANNMHTIEAIIKQVTFGKNAMPAFGERLESDDVMNVANFVLNQATTENW